MQRCRDSVLQSDLLWKLQQAISNDNCFMVHVVFEYYVLCCCDANYLVLHVVCYF